MLVERTDLRQREMAARVGVSQSTVGRLIARHGWCRFPESGAPPHPSPLPCPAEPCAPSTGLCPVPLPGGAGEDQPRCARPPRLPLAGQRGGGHPIVPEVVAEARALLEGTRLSFKAIAARTGVSRTTLCRWRKRNRWARPGASEAPARPTRYRRGRGTPYAADAVGMARDLVTGTLLSQTAIARQVGVSQAQISVWIRAGGWERPPVPPRSKRFAASKRTGVLAGEGDRRGRPYAPTVRRDACNLYELTRIGTALIGARLGVHPGTVARWAKEEAWERPRGRAGRAQLRGFFGSGKWRGS